VIHTRKNTKILVAFLVLTVYGSSVFLLKGKLPNQTANLVTTPGSKIQSLVPKQNVTYVALSLDSANWKVVKGENVTIDDSTGKLNITGTYANNTLLYQNKTLPLFILQQTDLELNFTGYPYLRTIISSQPDTETSFHLGWYIPDWNAATYFLKNHPGVVTEIEENRNRIWINISYPHSGEKIDDSRTHYITIDVAQRLEDLGLYDQRFVGIQLRQYLIGFLSTNKSYSVTIDSISLMKELPYSIAITEGKSQTLPEGSIVHVIRKEDIVNNFENNPHLQRAYILYTMDGSSNSLYTVFLLSKHNDDLTGVRCGFVFSHTSLLNDIGIYVDWRRPIPFDSDFEPIQPLYILMDNGDNALIFTSAENDKLQSVQLKKVEFTFSQLPYSAFVIPSLNEELVSIMSFFVLTIAGIIPIALTFALYYMHKKNVLRDDKKTFRNLLIIGLALRLTLASISAYADDTQIFAQIGALYFGSGVLGAQWVSLPGFVYLETASYFPYALLRAIGFRDFQFLALDVYCIELLFTKLPAILSDLGSFYFIQRIANKFSPKNKVVAAGLYLLNPLTVYISGILGQFDPIFMFALIVFTYYLICNYNVLKASLSAVFAAILNPVGIATSIPLLSTVYLRKDWKSAVKGLLLAAGIFSILLVPFFFESNSPVLLTSYERLINTVPGEDFYGRQMKFYTYGTIISSSVGYGLTFRFLFELIGFELGWWLYPFGAALAFLIFTIAFFYKTYGTSKVNSQDYIYTGTYMLGVACLFQLTFPTIYEQFVVWIAGLLLIFYLLHQDRKIFALFVLVCIAIGFVYVAMWRNYILLVSGVDVIPMGDPWLANLASASLGTIYSLVIIAIFIITCKLWFKEELSKLGAYVKQLKA